MNDEIIQFHDLVQLVHKNNKPVTMSADSLICLDEEIMELLNAILLGYRELNIIDIDGFSAKREKERINALQALFPFVKAHIKLLENEL